MQFCLLLHQLNTNNKKGHTNWCVLVFFCQFATAKAILLFLHDGIQYALDKAHDVAQTAKGNNYNHYKKRRAKVTARKGTAVDVATTKRVDNQAKCAQNGDGVQNCQAPVAPSGQWTIFFWKLVYFVTFVCCHCVASFWMCKFVLYQLAPSSATCLLNCVDNGNKRHHFRAGQEAINAVLCLSTKVFDGVCVEARDGLTAKIANCVGGNCKQSATAKILDALAIECAKCTAGKVRQAVAIYDVLCHAGAILLDATAFDS